MPALLALCAGISRWAIVRPTPANWDAVQFALALDRFDLHLHQPHPPGYILYIALGRLLDGAVGNPPVALALLGVLFSVVGVPLVYLVAMAVFRDRIVALGSALVVFASPLAAYYGSVGLTYLPEMALGTAVAGLAWTLKETNGVKVWLAATLGLLLGLSAGVRQTSLALLLPLCVWAVWGAWRDKWHDWAAFAGALVATCAAWGVPLVALSGGWDAYVRENSLLAGAVAFRTSVAGSGIEGVAYNVAFEGLALVVGLGLALIPLGLWALRLVRFSLKSRAKAFLLLWTVPPLLLYAASHVGQYGYLLVVLPPLAMLSAVCIRVLARVLAARWRAGAWRWEVAIFAAIVAFSAGYLLLAEGPTTALEITRNDEHWQAVEVALKPVDPTSTALVMELEWDGPFRHAGYLLPRFHSYAAGENKGTGEKLGWLHSAYGGVSSYSLPQPPPSDYLPLPPGTRAVIVLDEKTARRMQHNTHLESVALSDGSALYTLVAPANSTIEGLAIKGEEIVPVEKEGQ